MRRGPTGLAILLLAGGCAGTPPRIRGQRAIEAPEELYREGLAAADRGDLVLAEQWLALAIARGFPRAVAAPLLVRWCVVDGRLGTALRHLEPELERRPSAGGHLLAGALLTALGDPRAARDHLEQAVELAPSDPEARFQLGALLRRVDPAAAAPHLSLCLELAPRGPHASDCRGWLVEHATGTRRRPTHPERGHGGPDQRRAARVSRALP